MPSLTVKCDDCSKRWAAHIRDGEVVPAHESCPTCGGTEFTIPSHDDYTD